MSNTGMTIKQFARAEFRCAIDELREARAAVATDPARYVAACVRAHAAKNGVPRSWWPQVNRAAR